LKKQPAILVGLGILLILLVGTVSYGEEGPESAEGHFQKALEYEHSGKLEEAKGEYQKAITLDSKLINGFFNLGILYARQEQWQMAADSFEHVIRLNPNDAQAHFQLANAYDALWRPLEALPHYDRSQELGYRDQGNPPLGQLLGLFRDKEVKIQYDSLEDPPKKVILKIQGSSLTTGLLMQDVVKNLQFVDKDIQKGSVELIQVQFVKWVKGPDIWDEKWTVNVGEARHVYPIRFYHSADGGTDIQIDSTGVKP